jgi:hypothetical protein
VALLTKLNKKSRFLGTGFFYALKSILDKLKVKFRHLARFFLSPGCLGLKKIWPLGAKRFIFKADQVLSRVNWAHWLFLGKSNSIGPRAWLKKIVGFF